MRGGLSAALAEIRRAEGLSYKKAKRRFIKHVWFATSPGLAALKRKRLGLPYGLKGDRLKPAEAKVWRVTYSGGHVEADWNTGVITVSRP